jgi:hypothetical protein
MPSHSRSIRRDNEGSRKPAIINTALHFALDLFGVRVFLLSLLGQRRKSRPRISISAFGGKGDMRQTSALPKMTNSGHETEMIPQVVASEAKSGYK